MKRNSFRTERNGEKTRIFRGLNLWRGVFGEMILKWETLVSMHANASLEQLSVLTNKPLHHINDNFSRSNAAKTTQHACACIWNLLPLILHSEKDSSERGKKKTDRSEPRWNHCVCTPSNNVCGLAKLCFRIRFFTTTPQRARFFSTSPECCCCVLFLLFHMFRCSQRWNSQFTFTFT